MAEITMEKKKGLSRQTVMLIIFAVVVLGGGAYYYIANFAPTPESAVELQTKRQLQIRRVNWRSAVYEHETLKKLDNPLPGPLEIGPVGNPNPFRTLILE